LQSSIVHADDGAPVVQVTGEQTDSHYVLRVADTGPGIPSKELAEFQLPQPVDQLLHGTGLGLWFVHWTVIASNGAVSFDELTSLDGRGNDASAECRLTDPLRAASSLIRTNPSLAAGLGLPTR